MRNWILALILGAAAAASAQAASPMTQTSFQVALTWSLPAASGTFTGCTSSTPCAFVVWRAPATVSGGTATCPTAASSYMLLTTTASQATTYSDQSVTSGATECYVLQSSQGASGNGAPSAPFQAAIPTAPTSPSNGAATVTTVTVTVTTVP